MKPWAVDFTPVPAAGNWFPAPGGMGTGRNVALGPA